MSYQFALWVDINSERNEYTRALVSSINTRLDSQKAQENRSRISLQQIPKMEGLKLEAPQLPRNILIPDLQKLSNDQIKGNTFTPAPPVIRSENQKANTRTVKKFSNKYEYIWVMVTETSHPANKIFAQIYEAQKLENVNHNLQNLLAPEDYQKLKIFPKQGLPIKLMFDYYSYLNYIKRQLGKFEEDPKILEMYVEKEPNSGQGILPRNKIKNIEDLCEFIQKQVKSDVENCRKDKPYFNFIHSNSGPELFSRRSIIKNCLSNKSKAQLILNNNGFITAMKKHNKQQRLKRDQQFSKQTINTIQKLNESRQKYERWQQKISDFEHDLTHYLQSYYPIQNQDQDTKRGFYNWVIIQYCMESAVYPVVNNTIRFSANNQSVKPISTYVKLLYDAIRFYFTTRYREVNYKVVYRGSRVSIVEQSSFVVGRHLWNLGFMSTSRSEKVAQGFLSMGLDNPHYDKKEMVLIVIKISSYADHFQHISNQQGYFSLDRIPQIRKHVIVSEQQVLFNPLNIFEITKWDNDHKVLELLYAPHLQILQKKRSRMKLNSSQQEFLLNISKLKDVDFDKGQQHLEEGDPGAAVKYYQLSDQTGSNLSFSQRSNYIKGLRQIGSTEKMESILKYSLEEQKSAEKQLQAQTVASSTYDKISHSIQTLTLFEQTTDFIGADEKIEQVTVQSSLKSAQTPTQQNLLLQAQVYIKRANVKFGIGETFDCIKESIRGLKIIDELANVNFCYRLWQLGKTLRTIDRLELDQKKHKNLMGLFRDKKFFNMDIQMEREKLQQNMSKIRQWDIKQTQIQISQIQQKPSSQSQPPNKRQHKKAETLLKSYFSSRDNRTQVQKFEQSFIKSYFEISTTNLNRQGLTQKQEIAIREKLKVCQQQMFELKNDYKELFQYQVQAYQVLYRNLYKTSIDVRACLESYCGNFFRRFEEFIRVEVQFQGKESLDSAEVYWKHAEILYEYGQIIQRPKNPNLKGPTQSQKLANLKMQQTEQILKQLQSSQPHRTKSNSVYTYHRSELNRTRSRYFKSRTLQREHSRKLSIISDKSYKELAASTVASQAENQEKSELFKSLIEILYENNQLCEADGSINRSLYKIKNACDLIESLNQSGSVKENNRSYLERLRSCKKHFQDVISTINKYKEKEIMERNINMAHLYLLMGQNQFRLGLISTARGYLLQANTCLRKAIKIDDERYRDNTKINKQKLLLGNNTHIGCLRLEAHIVAYFGDRDEKQKTLENLMRKKEIMFATMNEPLNQADMNESIGLIITNMVIFHKQLGFSFSQAKKPYLQAIKIRDILLGPYNRYNARNYTLMVNLVSQPEIKNRYYQELKEFYKKALIIYDRINLSLDSTLILYKMQLQSTFLIFSNKYNQACQKIMKGLEEFYECPNKKMTLQSARQLYKCTKFLSQQKKYQKQGLHWLKYTCQFTIALQKFINKSYPMQDTDFRKYNIFKLKYEIITTIVKLEYQMFNKEIEEKYYNLYLDVKEKYEIIRADDKDRERERERNNG